MLSTFSLTQLVTLPTRVSSHSANTLDLILTSTPDLASDITCLPDISDHSLLTFCINAPFRTNSKKGKIIRNYRKANFEAINDELAVFLDVF